MIVLCLRAPKPDAGQGNHTANRDSIVRGRFRVRGPVAHCERRFRRSPLRRYPSIMGIVCGAFPRKGRVKKLITLFLLVALRATAQVNYGELRLKIADPSGAGIQASVELTCAGNGYDETFTSDPSGTLAVQTMPYGVYQIQIKKPGFASYIHPWNFAQPFRSLKISGSLLLQS